MNRLLCIALILIVGPRLASAQHAIQVTSYDAGSTAAAGYNNLSAPLGAPANTNGSNPFEGVISPFNTPYKTNDILSIGENGHLTLRLSNYVIPQALSREIGVFTNVGLADADYPNGKAGNTLGIDDNTFGIDSALVEVSENGTLWASLGNVTFDIPTNAYTDLTDPFSLTNGMVSADSQKPFAGSLADFAGKTYAGASPNILDVLAGSAGGTWLDISTTGLAQVGFIRFTVPENALARISLEVDAVSIAGGALGAPTVPEPATIALLGMALVAGAVPSARRRVR